MPGTPFQSRLCVSSLLWRNRPIADAARAMMRLGLRSIELANERIAPEHYSPDGDNSRLFNHLAEAGVSVAALRLTGLSYEEKIRAIADAGRRGIPAVLDRAERLNFPDLIDRVRTYAMCAEREGVCFILENDYFSSCDNAHALLVLAGVVRRPGLGFGFSPPHAVADNRDPAQEALELGAALRFAHLWDASESLKTYPLKARFYAGPPEDQTPGNGRGRVNWAEYFGALAYVGFGGFFNLRWQGADAWSDFQIEEALTGAVEFCSAEARRAGFA